MAGEVLETSSSEDIDRMGSREGPAVVIHSMAHTIPSAALQEPPKAEYARYLRAMGLGLWRAKHQTLQNAGIRSSSNNDTYSGCIQVAGWSRNPEHNPQIRDRFEKLASPFFPDGPGRDVFMMDLSRVVSAFASAVNTRRLLITFTAEERAPADFPPVFNFTSGDRIQGHLQLAGSSLFVAPPQKYSAEIWRKALAQGLRKTDHLMLLLNARASKPDELVAWQGRNCPHPVLTATTPPDGKFRLYMRLYPQGAKVAHPYPPRLPARVADWRQTSGLKHT